LIILDILSILIVLDILIILIRQVPSGPVRSRKAEAWAEAWGLHSTAGQVAEHSSEI
jgi:hypothetical protein